MAAESDDGVVMSIEQSLAEMVSADNEEPATEADDTAPPVQRRPARKVDPKDVTDRMQVLVKMGRPQAEAEAELAQHFGVAPSTIQRIWREHRRSTGSLKARRRSRATAAEGLPKPKGNTHAPRRRQRASGPVEDLASTLEKAAATLRAQDARIAALEAQLDAVRKLI